MRDVVWNFGFLIGVSLAFLLLLILMRSVVLDALEFISDLYFIISTSDQIRPIFILSVFVFSWFALNFILANLLKIL